MKNRLTAGLCVALVVAALPAAAATFVHMDTEELIASSAAVVQGKVLDTRSFWNADRTVIVTEARVEVEDLVAGEAPAVVTVKTFGGQVGDYRVVAEGFPTFAAGDEVLLFLTADGADFRVTGHQLGDYRVRRTEKGLMAVPTLPDGVRLFREDGRLGPRPKVQELGALKATIRARHETAILHRTAGGR